MSAAAQAAGAPVEIGQRERASIIKQNTLGLLTKMPPGWVEWSQSRTVVFKTAVADLQHYAGIERVMISARCIGNEYGVDMARLDPCHGHPLF